VCVCVWDDSGQLLYLHPEEASDWGTSSPPPEWLCDKSTVKSSAKTVGSYPPQNSSSKMDFVRVCPDCGRGMCLSLQVLHVWILPCIGHWCEGAFGMEYILKGEPLNSEPPTSGRDTPKVSIWHDELLLVRSLGLWFLQGRSTLLKKSPPFFVLCFCVLMHLGK
jgi:hypothetical protein